MKTLLRCEGAIIYNFGNNYLNVISHYELREINHPQEKTQFSSKNQSLLLESKKKSNT